MAFYINHQILDFATLRNSQGEWVQTTDEVKRMIQGAWKELWERFWKLGQPVVFITPGIKTQGGKGNQGYAYPRVVSVKTKRGNMHVAWADDVQEEGGKKVYSPLSKGIRMNEKTLQLSETEMEEAIFMFLFNPSVIKPGRLGGKTFLQDLEAEAVKYAETETSAAVVSYWLFRPESPFFANITKLSAMCLAWGVNPDGKSIPYLKQQLAEAIKHFEKKGDKEYGLNAFNTVCEKLKDGQDTREFDTQALIQKAIIRRVIRFDKDKFEWVLLGLDGKTKVKTICKVPPQQEGTAKSILKRRLIESPDDYDMIVSSMATGDEEVELRGDKVRVSVALPDPDDMTEAFITTTLSWHDRKRLFKALGEDPQFKKDDEITPKLIEYFVIQKRTVPFEVK
jgi:hypothetical protein